MSERLEEIKQVIANELGLTDNWMVGTYLYYLTRTKSALAIGTVTLDDFEEIDEELLEGIFNAIKPFFIEQAERMDELEKEIDERRAADIVAIPTVQKELKLKQQNEHYREALEYYADEKNWEEKDTASGDCMTDFESEIYFDNGIKARQALESESNE